MRGGERMGKRCWWMVCQSRNFASSSSSSSSLPDSQLLSVLQRELKHELSSPLPSQTHQACSLGDFVVDWDVPQTQDVVLRRTDGSGEEITVSALLSPPHYNENFSLPRHAAMKVCLTKPSLRNVLQFDCRIFSQGINVADIKILNAYHFSSPDCLRASIYKGPLFSSLDPNLQRAFKQYLISRGITVGFTSFLLQHLHKKEQNQYVNWLHKLETVIAKDS